MDDALWLRGLCELAQDWIGRQGTEETTKCYKPRTRAYCDLLFAFGLARLGAVNPSRSLAQRGADALTGGDDAHTLLLAAFTYRITQAQEGRPHAGPLPAEQRERLRELQLGPRTWEATLAYAVDRLRANARTLEPDEYLDPYRHLVARVGGLEGEMAQLPDVIDAGEFAAQVQRLLASFPRKKCDLGARARIVRTALNHAARVDPALAAGLIDESLAVHDESAGSDLWNAEWARLGLLLLAFLTAVRENLPEQVRQVMARLRAFLPTASPVCLDGRCAVLLSHCFRLLKESENHSDLDQFVQVLSDWMLQGRDPITLAPGALLKQAGSLTAWACMAGGWYDTGRTQEAEALLGSIRTLLFEGGLEPKVQGPLACAYAAAAPRASVGVRERMEEMFTRVERVRDLYTTNLWYSSAQLQVIDAAVLGVVEAQCPPPVLR